MKKNVNIETFQKTTTSLFPFVLIRARDGTVGRLATTNLQPLVPQHSYNTPNPRRATRADLSHCITELDKSAAVCSCACNIIPDHHSVQHPCVAATNDVVVKQHFQTPRIRLHYFRPYFRGWGCVRLKRHNHLDGFWPKTRMKMVSPVFSSSLPWRHNQDPLLMSVCGEGIELIGC